MAKLCYNGSPKTLAVNMFQKPSSTSEGCVNSGFLAMALLMLWTSECLLWGLCFCTVRCLVASLAIPTH